MNIPAADDIEADVIPPQPPLLTPHASTPVDINTPGHALRDARQERKLEIMRIASELRLTPDTVDALEHNDYRRLPSAVFVAGYIRSYARLLGLDPEPLIARFRELHPDAEASSGSVPSVRGQTAKRPPHKPLFLSMPLLALICALALIGAMVYLSLNGENPFATASSSANNQEQPSRVSTEPDMSEISQAESDALRPKQIESDPIALVPSSDPPLAGSEAAEQIDPTASDSDPTAIESTSVILDRPNDIQQPAVETAPALAPPPLSPQASVNDTQSSPVPLSADVTSEPDAAAPDTSALDTSPAGQVVIAFSDPCWVNVRDASGQAQLFGEMAKGDRHVLGGEPPYSLVLGNAAGVELTVGGKPFDVRAIAKGNVARFNLDPAELQEDQPTNQTADGVTTAVPSTNFD